MTVPLGLYGDRLASAGEVLVSANPTPKQAQAAIEVDRFCRNRQHPSATLQNQINAAANAAVLYRSKQVFAIGDMLDETTSISSGGAGDRARWKFSFHSGPYSHALYAVVVMRQPSSNFTNNTYSRLDISTSSTYASTASSQTFTYGNDPTNGTYGGWPYFKVLQGFLDISPDTAYYGAFYDVDAGRILSACVFDLQSLTENFNGYIASNMTTHSSVLNLHRQYPVTISNALWQSGGAHVLNWGVNDGTAPITIASATAKNVVDTSSTAVSASTPGYTLDMIGKDRESQTSGVPCIMKAYGSYPLGASGTAHVYLKNSAGTIIATCSFPANTSGWISSGSFNLPASVDKYDLHYAAGGASTFSLYAVSIYEKD